MKKKLLIIFVLTTIMVLCGNNQSISATQTQETSITKQVAEKTVDTTKEITNKAIQGSKNIANKTVKASKSTAKKTGKTTKSLANKAAAATKNAAKKTVESTKNITDKAVDGTKDLIDELPVYKEVTVEGLEKEAAIKKIKFEKKEIRAAYNSRIKDTKAKIKAAENSTLINDTEKRNRIHLLTIQTEDLEKERDAALAKYDLKLKEIKNK